MNAFNKVAGICVFLTDSSWAVCRVAGIAVKMISSMMSTIRKTTRANNSFQSFRAWELEKRELFTMECRQFISMRLLTCTENSNTTKYWKELEAKYSREYHPLIINSLHFYNNYKKLLVMISLSLSNSQTIAFPLDVNSPSSAGLGCGRCSTPSSSSAAEEQRTELHQCSSPSAWSVHVHREE